MSQLNLGFNWNSDVVREIRKKAESGTYIVRGGNCMKRLPHFDDLVVLCAQNSRPPIDSYREPCETKTTIGSRYAEKPLEIDYPIILSAMSFGAISREAKIAFAKGASIAGIPVNTGEGGMLPEERRYAKKVIAQYASGRFGISSEVLNSADAIEIKIGQGAKAGMGGHLPGEKVTAEISAIRGIKKGTDALSPARHMDIVGPEDLAMKITQLREIMDWRIPIIVKYSPGRVDSDVKIAAKAGADAIVVDGMQGGTGAAPDVGIENSGIPTIAALVSADRALREMGLRNEVDLIVSGGIRSGADIAKALALGADAVGISTAAMISIGCTACGMCHLGKCPVGITTQVPELRKRLNVEASSRKFANFIQVLGKELMMLTQLTGKTDVHNLDIDDVRSLDYNTSMITGVKLVGA